MFTSWIQLIFFNPLNPWPRKISFFLNLLDLITLVIALLQLIWPQKPLFAGPHELSSWHRHFGLIIVTYGFGIWLVDKTAQYSLYAVQRRFACSIPRLLSSIAFLVCQVLEVFVGNRSNPILLVIGSTARVLSLSWGQYRSPERMRQKELSVLLPSKANILDSKIREWKGRRKENEIANLRFNTPRTEEEKDLSEKLKPSREGVWHAPNIFKIQDSALQIEVETPSDRSDPLFCRCYCCLTVSDAKPTPNFRSHKMGNSKRSRNRLDFLNLSPMSHFGDVRSFTGLSSTNSFRDVRTSYPTHEEESAGAQFAPHNLCYKCEYICQESTGIRSLVHQDFITWLRMVWDFITTNPSPSEIFQHYSTPSELRASAQGKEGRGGCHLCNLIWNTLSEPQKNYLIMRSRETEEDGDALNDDSDFNKTCIYIRVESWSIFSLTAYTSSGSDITARLIPHFGSMRVARRWTSERIAARKIHLNRDPLLNFYDEQAEAIVLSKLYGTWKLQPSS